MHASSNDDFITGFLKKESSGGIVLMCSAVLAILFANLPLNTFYHQLLNTPVAIQIGALHIDKPLLLWINDGLMAVFFFLVGLELKRELLEGELSDPKNLVLPAVGAIGGMAFPAIIYCFFNWGDPVAIKGWAIPAATDIAFALGVLALLGPRVPISVKIFLTSLAIFDDIGAIVIIAAFYTAKISFTALIVVAACLPVLAILNRLRVTATSVYITVGVVMWVAMLKSGVHATLAGVLLAAFIPLKGRTEGAPSPLKHLEHRLHFWVAFMVLPIFAFANAGLSLKGVSAEQVFHPVPLGIALGLFFGKQIGIFGLCWLAVKVGLTRLPKGMNMMSMYAVSILCGIGFTMSLFIGSLAFSDANITYLFDERLGIILGSLASGILGYFVLKMSLSKQAD